MGPCRWCVIGLNYFLVTWYQGLFFFENGVLSWKLGPETMIKREKVSDLKKWGPRTQQFLENEVLSGKFG